MADLEIFVMNEDGAGWVTLDKLSQDEKIDLELAVMTNAETKVLCYVCLVEIPSGTGNACAKHKENK